MYNLPMNKIHELIHRLNNPNMGILFIRLALAAVFINAGWFKVSNLEMVVGGFGEAGIPAFLAYVVSYGEFIGGIALLLGIFARYFGILLSIIMAVAIAKVHFVNGFNLQNGGYEYVLVLLLGAMAMVTFGSGKYSVAGWLKNRK
jgi:putative oxidoreductase